MKSLKKKYGLAVRNLSSNLLRVNWFFVSVD